MNTKKIPLSFSTLAVLVLAALSLSLVPAKATELIVNGNFESGSTGWTLSGGTTISTLGSFYHSATHYLWCGDDNGTDVAYQDVTIPGSATAATLSFYYNINTSETSGSPDTFSATIRNTGGTVLATVGNWSNLNGTSPGVYTQQTYNVLPYAGQTIRIYFASSCTLTGSKTTNFRIDDVSVSVTTSTTYTITVSASPTAGGTVSGGGTFTSGTSQTVTATANSGYAFANWTENGSVVSSSASYNFTLNGNRNLVANFTANPVNYTISVSASPTAGGTVSGGGTFASGSSRTVTATANSGYAFANWTENSSVVSSSASYNFTLNANRTLVANFTTSGTQPLGVDVSVFNGTVNWSQVSSPGGKSFALIRASAGVNTTDANFAQNAANAHSAGLLVGAYHFAYPQSFTAQAEAQKFLSVASSYIGTGYLPPTLDIEDSPSEDSYPYLMGQTALSQWIRDWCSAVKQATGVTPMVYATRYYANNYFDANLNQFPFWVPTYSSAPTLPNSNPGNISPWSTWTFQQYQSDPTTQGGGPGGTCSGISGYVDLDSFNGDLSALQALANQTVVTTPAITSPIPGSTFSSASVTFQWSSGTGVSDYFLYVGTSVGANDLYGQDQGLNQSVTVNNLPQNGSTLYVRLYWEISGVWYATDYTYTAHTAAATPTITSPTPSSTLTSSSATFQWSSGTGVSDYFLYVGSSLGANDIYAQDQGLNQSVTVNNLPQNGSTLYVRLYWEISGSYYTADYTYTAYTQPTYTVTLSASPTAGGTVSGGGTFASGSSQTVTATANSGYTFANWTESGTVVSSSASYNFTLNGNRSLVANFTANPVNYTISVSASPTAGGTVSGGGSFVSGTSQTVTATANSGYTFANWTESGTVVSSSASYNFTLNGNRSLVANFTANPVNYTISVSASPTAGGTVSGGGTFVTGSPHTVTATANVGYTFANWTENSSVVSSSASYVFTLNANRNLVANFNVIVPPTFGGISISAGKLQTSLTGLSVGETVVLYGSTDLRNWTPMQTNVASGNTVTFTNTVNPAIPGQYFRVGVH